MPTNTRHRRADCLRAVVPSWREERASHCWFDFDDVAGFLFQLEDDSFAAEGCAPGDIEAKRDAELTNSYVVRFLDQVLRNGLVLSATANPKDIIFAAR